MQSLGGNLRPLTIIGGGLAGLTLGIGLRQRGVPVTIQEAGRYPRHRVCGEFVCGRGPAALERLGLREVFDQAGAVPARTAAFFLGACGSPVRPLPQGGLALSRAAMDASLAQRFRSLGGELLEDSRWREGRLGEGIIRATGRRLHASCNGSRWFGLKAHARHAALTADVEMHCLEDGYVGLSRLAGDRVNVCGLFRRRSGSEGPPESWPKQLRGSPGSALNARLAGASFDESSFCSVAGLPIELWWPRPDPECCIGDALTMIPPVTGNGMSMAFEAAEIAVEPLCAYSRGGFSWTQAVQQIRHACEQTFSGRLAWARLLHWMMFSRWLRKYFGTAVLKSDWVWRRMFALTR